MEGKRGSAGEWFLVVLVMVVIGGIVLFISTQMFYKKSEVYAKGEVDSKLADVSSCKYISLADTSTWQRNVGKTPLSVCNEIGKEPQLLLIKQSTQVFSDGTQIYQDSDYLVDNTLLNSPIGRAEDIDLTYGNPSFGKTGKLNKFTEGILCC